MIKYYNLKQTGPEALRKCLLEKCITVYVLHLTDKHVRFVLGTLMFTHKH